MITAALPRTRRPSRLREFASSVSTIMAKELRSRFRGRRAFVVITMYLGVLALIAYGAYTETAAAARSESQLIGGFDGSGPTIANASATVGQAIFSQLSVFQLLLVAFLAPAFTSGAISLERERATLDLLVTTPMRPGAIVIGKLFSALVFVALMILTSIPVSALVFMYGGASLDDIVRQQVVLFASAMGFGVIGIFCSTLIKRTQTATVVAYSTVLFLAVGTYFIWRLWSSAVVTAAAVPFGPPGTAPEQLLYLNPAVAMIEIVADTEITPGDFGRIMAEVRGQTGLVCEGDKCVQTEGNSGGGVVPGQAPAPASKLEIAEGCPPNPRCAAPAHLAVFQPQPVTGHFLPRFALTFVGMSLVLTLASMRLVVPAGLRFSFRRRRAAAHQLPDAADEDLIDG